MIWSSDTAKIHPTEKHDQVTEQVPHKPSVGYASHKPSLENVPHSPSSAPISHKPSVGHVPQKPSVGHVSQKPSVGPAVHNVHNNDVTTRGPVQQQTTSTKVILQLN